MKNGPIASIVETITPRDILTGVLRRGAELIADMVDPDADLAAILLEMRQLSQRAVAIASSDPEARRALAEITAHWKRAPIEVQKIWLQVKLGQLKRMKASAERSSYAAIADQKKRIARGLILLAHAELKTIVLDALRGRLPPNDPPPPSDELQDDAVPEAPSNGLPESTGPPPGAETHEKWAGPTSSPPPSLSTKAQFYADQRRPAIIPPPWTSLGDALSRLLLRLGYAS